MPTAAKLMSAIALGLLAIVVSEQVKPLLPEGTDFGYFSLVNAGFAAYVGWKLIGKRAGRGVAQSINNGLTGMLAMLLLVLFAHSFWIMYENSRKLRYGSVSEAIQDIFSMMTEYGLLLLQVNIITTLLGGAVFCGLLAEATSRRWR
ncbi:TrgA family protein [Cognatishimia activa]|uniref:TrgA family protein n=1 Tax=Cognatishimia activa TaxID=1715691 RepID=UPI0022320FD1|nr:TrgA family protein [Cognatishimia activa]UZD92088.1 TrgA family protein [Cognatishimia activa]